MNTPEENLAELIYNKLVLLFATEADPDIRRTFGIALLNVYFHHTPNTEGGDAVEAILSETVDNQMVYDTFNEEQKRCFHTNIRNVATKAITSRDTYWKERVRGMKWETNHVPFATEEQIRKCTCSACKHNQALDTLLDNLK